MRQAADCKPSLSFVAFLCRQVCFGVQRAAVALPLLAAACCPGYVRVTLRADANTNQGRPLRVLVRSIDEQQHRSESYAAVSALVTQPDATVLRALTLDPRQGYSRSFWVKSAKEKPLGLYFLYTAPAASWKIWLQPALPWRITVPLGRAGVLGNGVTECRIFRR